MRLPSLKPQAVVRALKRAGFEKMRQTGSHLILAHRGTTTIVTVPMHSGDIHRGLLMGIIKQAGLTQREFADLL